MDVNRVCSTSSYSPLHSIMFSCNECAARALILLCTPLCSPATSVQHELLFSFALHYVLLQRVCSTSSYSPLHSIMFSCNECAARALILLCTPLCSPATSVPALILLCTPLCSSATSVQHELLFSFALHYVLLQRVCSTSSYSPLHSIMFSCNECAAQALILLCTPLCSPATSVQHELLFSFTLHYVLLQRVCSTSSYSPLHSIMFSCSPATSVQQCAARALILLCTPLCSPATSVQHELLFSFALHYVLLQRVCSTSSYSPLHSIMFSCNECAARALILLCTPLCSPATSVQHELLFSFALHYVLLQRVCSTSSYSSLHSIMFSCNECAARALILLCTPLCSPAKVAAPS